MITKKIIQIKDIKFKNMPSVIRNNIELLKDSLKDKDNIILTSDLQPILRFSKCIFYLREKDIIEIECYILPCSFEELDNYNFTDNEQEFLKPFFEEENKINNDYFWKSFDGLTKTPDTYKISGFIDSLSEKKEV